VDTTCSDKLLNIFEIMSSPNEIPEDETMVESQGIVQGGSNVDSSVELSSATGTNALTVQKQTLEDVEREKKQQVVFPDQKYSGVDDSAFEENKIPVSSLASTGWTGERPSHVEASPINVEERNYESPTQGTTYIEKPETSSKSQASYPQDSSLVVNTGAEAMTDKNSAEERLEEESASVTVGKLSKSETPNESVEHPCSQGANSQSYEEKDKNVQVKIEAENPSEHTVSSDSKTTAIERSRTDERETSPKEENTPTFESRESTLSSSPKQKLFGKNDKLERKMALLAKLNEVESKKLKYMEKKNTPISSPLEKTFVTERMSPPTLDIQSSFAGENSESRTASSPQESEPDKSSRSLRPRTPGSQLNSVKLVASPHTPGSDYKEDPLYYKCRNILKSLMERKDARAFLKPVDELFTPEEIPGYFEIIQHPMDLGTVLYRMELGLYRHPTMEDTPKYAQFDLERFKADVRLVWENAMTYNLQGTPYHVTAAKLSETFERKLEATLKSLPETKSSKSKEKKRPSVSRSVHERPVKKANTSSAKRKTSSEGSSHKAAHHSFTKVKPAAPTSAGTTTVSTDNKNRNDQRTYSSFAAASHASMTAESPSSSIQKLQEKIKELERIQARMASSNADGPPQEVSSSSNPLGNVPMTYEEKRRLGDNINLLPGDKLAKVVQIIMRHKGSTPVNDREEIEIDIDALDTRTLREMEAFVQSALQKRVQKKKGASVGETFTTQTSSVTSELENLREQLRTLQGTNYDMGMTLESGQTASATSGGGGGLGRGDQDKRFDGTGHVEESGNNELSTVPESSHRDSTELKQQQQQEAQMYSSDDSDSTSDTASVSDN